MMAAAYAQALAACTLIVAAHLLLKHGAVNSRHRHVLRLWWNPMVLASYVLFFVATLFNLKAYQVLPLKVGVYLGALMLVAVVAGARLMYRERLSPRSLIGVFVIVAGVIVFNV